MNNIEPFYLGVVEDRMDPLKLGRVKVRVLGIHTHNKSTLPTDDLPWAYKVQPTTSGAISGIGHAPVGVMEGTWVVVQYLDPDKQIPYVTGTLGGIPQKNNPLFEEYSLTDKQDNVILRDSSGNPVTDGSGNPVTTGEPAPEPEPPKAEEPQTTTGKGGCCGVDTSPMEQQFGSNVSVVCKALCDAGIKDPYAIIAILSNVAKESKFRLVRESLVYSSVARIRQIFPGSTKNKTDAELQQYVRNEEPFANFIYANKIGNSSEASGDGWKYRGGGFVQLTGKANYRSIGGKIGVNLEANPDSINDPSIAAKAVAEYMKSRIGSPTYGSLDEACRAVTKAINPGGLSNDLPKVVNYSKLCYIVGEATPAQKKEQQTQPTQQTPQQTTQQRSGGGVNITSVTQDGYGFRDPNKVYPLADHLNEPDTNRLARAEKIFKTSVFKKESLKHTGVPQANGTGSWDQSPIPYNAAYPFNNVWQSESGHLLEFDDTKGRERINLYHRTGTFTEVDHNGTQVNFIIGDGYQIFERNGFVHVQGAMNVTVDGAHTLRVEGTADVEIHGKATINIHNNADLNVAGNLNVTSGGSMYFKAGGNIAMDAPRIDFNSGVAAGLRTIGAKSPTAINYGELNVLVRAEEIAVDYEVTDDDPVAVRAYQNKLIEEGISTREELEAKPEKIEETKPEENKVEEKITECGIPEGKTDFTGSEQLSKFYKLGDLNAGNTRKLIKVGNFTPGEIFCNLKALAENCLDPIKARYPNMVINSGFRNFVPPGGSTKSQHLTGQAVDISFPGLTRAQLYDRIQEIQQMIPYDQLILEYANGPGWVHISFSKSGNKKQHFTMNHHKRISDFGTFARVA